MNSAKHLSPTLMKGRKAPPSHLLFKIQYFSLLSKASVEKYTSEEFEAGGYKWNVCIYPTGSKEKDGQDHISIYLNLVVGDSSSFPSGWEVNAIVNIFAYNFRLDEYVSTQDASARRFHVLQTEWGIPKFIDLATFKDPLKGYLKNDTCVFGAEVFIVNPTSKGEYLSFIHEPMTSSFKWNFEDFSDASCEKYNSEIFVAGNHKWKLLLYPNGAGTGKGNNVALFLTLINSSSLQANTKLYVYYILRAINQKSGQHVEHKYYNHFSNSSCTWGTCLFVPLAELKDPKKGFLLGNTCVFEVEVEVLGSLKPMNY